jgi:arabinogalactan oligomer/maltooligosaccharide transport system substrate-binding protein
MKKVSKLFTLLMIAVMVITGLVACKKKSEETKSDDDSVVTEEAKNEEPTKKAEATKAPTTTEAPTVETEDVALKVWAPQEEQELLAKMCNDFQSAHPEYKISFEFGVVSEADAANELTKDPAAGADVFSFASDQTSNLVNTGILYPLTLDVDAIKAANSEASIQAATVNGQLYANPFTPNSWFMYYDKSKYNEDEVLSLEKMMAKDLGEGVKNFSVDINNGWYLSSFFFAGGCQLFGADGTDPNTVTFNDANGVAVANYLIDLAANPKFLDEDNGNILTAFADGKLGAACSGTWNAEAIKEALGDNYAATKLPTIQIMVLINS